MKMPSQKSSKKAFVANRKVKESKGIGEKVQEKECQAGRDGGNRSKGILESDFPGQSFLSIQETEACKACKASHVKHGQRLEFKATKPLGTPILVAEHGPCL